MGSPRVTASPRVPRPARLGPRLTPPPLGKLLLPHGLSLRCVTVCASVSISERMPSPVPCPSPALRLSVSRSVSPSLCLSLPVCACALVSVCLSVSVCICLAPSWECVSEPSSLSVSVSPDPRPPTGAMAVALAAALAPAVPAGNHRIGEALGFDHAIRNEGGARLRPRKHVAGRGRLDDLADSRHAIGPAQPPA